MTPDRPTSQLVEQITAMVLAELASRGLHPASPTSADVPTPTPGAAQPAERVEVRAPAGVCTGDYSKFPELAGRLTSAPPPEKQPAATPAPAATPPAEAPATPLGGLITESQLQDALAAAGGRGVLLARDAKLTPLAADLARRLKSRIVREGQASALRGPRDRSTTSAAAPRSADRLPWLWWIDGHCPAVPAIVQAHAASLVPASAPRTPAGLAQVIRDVATGLRQQRIAGGILLVPSAARAMCLANRCDILRACVGTCPEAVEHAITEIGANVLILEYPYTRGEKMAAMVAAMVRQVPQLPALVARELAEMHRL